ncbi:hypothetical protein K438DRAFT_2006570 [Mycena galopus ATCC 62051]|nr:hypothetical protein K438DRAFT_2006570 [Mycena galopus ATCC 62051]
MCDFQNVLELLAVWITVYSLITYPLGMVCSSQRVAVHPRVASRCGRFRRHMIGLVVGSGGILLLHGHACAPPPSLSIYMYADAAPLLPSGILRIRHVNFDYVTPSSFADMGTLQVHCIACTLRQIAKWRRAWTFGSIASFKPVFLGTQLHWLFSNGLSAEYAWISMDPGIQQHFSCKSLFFDSCPAYSTYGSSAPVDFGDCEYTESGPSSGQVLEEQISILQARIEQLEKPKDKRLTLTMTQAWGSRGSSQMSPTQISPSNTMAFGPLLTYFRAAVNSSAANTISTELPFIVLQALVHNFLHNANCFGFFFNTQAFHGAVTSTNGRTYTNQPSSLTLSEAPPAASREPILAQSSTVHRHLFCSLIISSEMRGRWRGGTTPAPPLSAGLHLIRGRSKPPPAETLPPPSDPVEEGERIAACWSVLTLNNCWAGVDGAPSNVTYGPGGLTIDTPWPLEARDYVEGGLICVYRYRFAHSVVWFAVLRSTRGSR